MGRTRRGAVGHDEDVVARTEALGQFLGERLR